MASNEWFERVADLIEAHREPGWIDFLGPAESQFVSDEEIREVEERMGVKLPPGYIWFLKQYGGGRIAGLEVSDINPEKQEGVVYPSDLERRMQGDRYAGLDDAVVILDDEGDWIYFLALDERREDGECPVKILMRDEGRVEYVAEHFLEFIEKEILTAARHR